MKINSDFKRIKDNTSYNFIDYNVCKKVIFLDSNFLIELYKNHDNNDSIYYLIYHKLLDLVKSEKVIIPRAEQLDEVIRDYKREENKLRFYKELFNGYNFLSFYEVQKYEFISSYDKFKQEYIPYVKEIGFFNRIYTCKLDAYSQTAITNITNRFFTDYKTTVDIDPNTKIEKSLISIYFDSTKELKCALNKEKHEISEGLIGLSEANKMTFEENYFNESCAYVYMLRNLVIYLDRKLKESDDRITELLLGNKNRVSLLPSEHKEIFMLCRSIYIKFEVDNCTLFEFLSSQILMNFLTSAIFINSPCVDINAMINANFIVSRDYKPSDFIDNMNIKCLSPISSYFVTDKKVVNDMRKLGIDKKYQTKLFSLKPSELNNFLCELEEL